MSLPAVRIDLYIQACSRLVQASAMKPGKKLVPASFAEVIDSLLDSLQRYKPPVAEPDTAPAQEGPTSMEMDAPSQPSAAAQAPSAEAAHTGSSAPASDTAAAEASAAAEARAKEKRKVTYRCAKAADIDS